MTIRYARAAVIKLGVALVCASIVLTGCTMFRQLTPSYRQAQQRSNDVEALQLRVMSFADEYVGRIGEAARVFIMRAETPEDRLAGQNWKIQQATAAYTIASGPNPVANALDFVVLATLSRLVLDDFWVEERFGDRARVVQQAHRDMEPRAWTLVENELSPSQAARLKEIVREWRVNNPDVRYVAYMSFRDFAKSIGVPSPEEEHQAGGLFSMLGIDPLSSLEPAVREVAQSRQLAERAIFYAQRTPMLLDMQVERMAYQLASMPEARSLLTDIDRFSHVGSASQQLADTLPGLVAREREALVEQLLAGLRDQQDSLGGLSDNVRATLQAGTETAAAVDAVLKSLDHVVARFPPESAEPGGDGPKKPFDVQEYTQLMREVAATARQIAALTEHIGNTLPALDRLANSSVDRLEQMTDDLFRRLLWLIAFVAACALAVFLAARFISIRYLSVPTRQPGPE